MGSLGKGNSIRRVVCPRVAILTTAGVTLSSIGARLGNGCPSTAIGKAACAVPSTSSINRNGLSLIASGIKIVAD
jgi:hypothetical protein